MIGIVKLAKVLPKGKWTILLGLVIFGLTLFYFAHLQNTVFPWTTYRDFSNTLHYPLSLSYYLLGLGPISYFALFSLPHLFQFLPSSLYPSSYILLFLLSWAISPFFSIFVLTPFTNLPNSHFFQAYHFIPLSILAAIGAKKTWEVTCWLADHGSNLSQFRTNKMVPLGLVGLLVIYFLIPWYQSIKASLSQYPGHPYNIYLPKELTTAFEFLNKNSTQEEVVLSGPFIGGLLPAYTHNRSLHGHPVNTYKVSLKNAQVDQFYKQNDVDFAKKLVEEYQISYVIFTFDAPQPDLAFVQALNLTPVYHNDRVSIYRTMKSPRAEPDTRRYLAEPVGFFRLRRISSAEAERASAFIHG